MNNRKDTPSGALAQSSVMSGRILPIFWGAVVAGLALMPLFHDSQYTLHLLILTFIYAIASMSLRTIMVSGQFPLGHAAFMGVGAYVAGTASKWLGWPAYATVPAGAFAAAALGILSGYPFSRLRALYYAMGSMFFGIGIVAVINALGKYTGSFGGLSGIHPMFEGGKQPYYYFFLALAVVSSIALHRFESCRIGVNLRAAAQSHLAASAVGINEGYYRILAVAVGCFFAGLAGAGYAHYNLSLSPASFNFLATLWLVMYVLVGGANSFSGPLVGTFVLFLSPEVFRDLQMYAPLVSAALLLIVVSLIPKGLVSLPGLFFRRRKENGSARKVVDAS